MRTKKDSIERFQQKKIQDISNQSKYLQELLTASLPRYYPDDQQEISSSRIIAAKRSYANDSSIKWISNDEQSPIKFKKTFNKMQLSKSINSKKLQSIQITPRKQYFQKTPRKSTIFNQTPSPKLKNQDNLEKHPYSIIKFLQNQQKNLPEDDKKIYKYRGVNQLKHYNLQEISNLTDNLLGKITDPDKLSITDQFLLMNYIDLKIQKIIELSKIQEKKYKTKVPQTQNYATLRKQKEKNKDLIKSLQEINTLWDLYQHKLNYCPDILKYNGGNDQIIIEMRKLHQQILKLGEQIQKHEETCVHKKVNRSNPDPCYQTIIKKIKTVMKRFKEILTIKRL